MLRRSIVRDPLFEDSLERLIRNAERADEYTAAAEDLLSQEPEMGKPMAGDVWALPMNPVGGKVIYPFYTFDESTVLFIALAPLDD